MCMCIYVMLCYVMGQRMAPPAEAQRLSLESDFCFCPTGDAKGFTARLYFSLLLGCLPVRVDGWQPYRLGRGQLKMNTHVAVSATS